VSAVTIFKHAKKGRIPSFRIGSAVRFCPKTIAELAARPLKRLPLGSGAQNRNRLATSIAVVTRGCGARAARPSGQIGNSQMSQQFKSQYLNDCVEHALKRCQQVTPIRADVIRLIQRALDHSHETSTGICPDLRQQHEKQVSRLRGLDPWEGLLLTAAKGLLMSQPAMKINRVLPECRLALDELETRFYCSYHAALGETDYSDWRYNYSWISQESDWQQHHSLAVPPYGEVG
jgi:hypothetical protein